MPPSTEIRIGLAVSEHRGDRYSLARHARSARLSGFGLDEISRNRSFSSNDPKEAALLAFLEGSIKSEGHPPVHLLEEAREADWSDEQLIEALGEVALCEFQSLIANAAGLPEDQIDSGLLPQAA